MALGFGLVGMGQTDADVTIQALDGASVGPVGRTVIRANLPRPDGCW